MGKVCKLLTVGFGHGIATTLLQLTKGYSIISNGGFDVSPTLIKKNNYEKTKRIISEEVSKKINPITVVPIGIAYSEVTPKFRGKFCLCFGEPIKINQDTNLTIDEFNAILNKKMIQAETEALKIVGR